MPRKWLLRISKKPDDDDVIRKVMGDLTAGGVSITEEELRAKMVECLGQAIDQIQNS